MSGDTYESISTIAENGVMNIRLSEGYRKRRYKRHFQMKNSKESTVLCIKLHFIIPKFKTQQDKISY